MQEDESEECFYQITRQTNEQEQDDSSQSYSRQYNKIIDNAMVNLLEGVNYQVEQQCDHQDRYQKQSYDQNKGSTKHSINTDNERFYQGEDVLRQKKFTQIAYIQPDQSFRHQIKLINRNVQPSVRTRELFKAESKSPKNISSQQNSFELKQQQNNKDKKNSLQNSIQIDGKYQLSPNGIIIPVVDKLKTQIQDNYQYQQIKVYPNENNQTLQLNDDSVNKEQKSISSIDESNEEVPLQSTQFKNKKNFKYQQYKANLNQFQLESKPISPSDSNNSNPYGFVPNSQIAKIFGVPSPPSSISYKLGCGQIQNCGDTLSNLCNSTNPNSPNNLTPLNNIHKLNLNQYNNVDTSDNFQFSGSILPNKKNQGYGNSQKNGNILKNGNISLNGTISNSENYPNHSFEYTLLNPKQFMAELKSLKLFYEPLELVSMKTKKQGGGCKTLARKLDINILQQIQHKINLPSFQVKQIHIPIKDQVVNIKKDGAWAQIKKNMNNFYENLDSICEFLNGKENSSLDQVQFDNVLSKKNSQDEKKRQFKFPLFMAKNKTETNQQFTHFYNHLLQKIFNLNEIPYSESDMSQNLIIIATQSLEYLNLSENMQDKYNEEQNKKNELELLKQIIFTQKTNQKLTNESGQKKINRIRQKSTYETSKAYDVQSSLYGNSLENINNKSINIMESSKINENQFNSQEKQQFPHLYQQSQFMNDTSQMTSNLFKEKSFIPYQLRNQNEQLWSDSKKKIETINNLQDDLFGSNNNSKLNQNQDNNEVNPFNSKETGTENEYNVQNQQLSLPIKYYRQTQNKVFQFTPQEENTNYHNRTMNSKNNNNRNQSCRNSSSQKGKLSPLSLYKNHQQFDKVLFQRIQKQTKQQHNKTDNQLDNMSIFSKSIPSSTVAADKYNSQNSQSNQNYYMNEEKIIYPFKLKHIKVKKQNSNSINHNINNSNLKLMLENNKSIQNKLNAYERMQLYSNLEHQSNYIENSFEKFQQSPISQTVQITPFQQSPKQQLNLQSVLNSQSVDLQIKQEETKQLLNYYKQQYDTTQIDSTFEKYEFNQRKEYRRTLVNQINDTKFADSFNKQFLVKFGYNSSRQISEVLSRDSFFNHTKEELDIIFGQFLILSNYSLKFMEKPLQEFLKEINQNEIMSTKQKTNIIFQKCLYTKFSVLKDAFSVFRRLKELQIINPVLKFILQNNEVVDQEFNQGKEGDIKIYWKDFLRFNVFLIEQKWTRFDKISFILSVINQNNQQSISIKQIDSTLPDNMKVSDPKQIKLMKEFLFNPQYLIDGNKVPFARINDCLQKEFFLNINEIINHFLIK